MPRQRKSGPGRKLQLPDNIVRKEGKTNLYGRVQIGKLRKRLSLGTPNVDEAWGDYLADRDRVTFSKQWHYVAPRRWAKISSAEWQQNMDDNIVERLGDFYLDKVSEAWCWHHINTRRRAKRGYFRCYCAPPCGPLRK